MIQNARKKKGCLMPVKTVEIKPVTEEEFHKTDYLVMKHIFDAHNNLGHFYDETIYSNELKRRCLEAGFESVETEVPVTVSHKEFSKTYFLDVLINRSVVYELKTVRTINGNNRRQLLNYLFLCRLHHGKLVNFRTPQVTHEFVSTTLDWKQRHIYDIICNEWKEVNAESIRLKSILEDLLEDWGAFLEASLYMDAIEYFFGGTERVATPVEIRQGGSVIGRQNFKMLTENTAFFITAIKHKIDYRKHLKSLLGNTSINCVQWINMDKHDIELVTIT